VLELPDVAELVDDEVLVHPGPLQQDEMPGGIAAEAPEARHGEQPRHDDQPDAVEVDRHGIERKPVQPRLRPPEYVPRAKCHKVVTKSSEHVPFDARVESTQAPPASSLSLDNS
jgi:hypothetical protein